MNVFCLTRMVYECLMKIGTNTGIHITDLCFLRTFGLFIIACGSVKYYGKKPFEDVPKEYRWLLFVRCLVGLIGLNVIVYAVKVLPIFVVSIIFNTGPFWASLLSYLVLKENVTRSELIGICGCFTGICVLAYGKK